MTSTAHAVYKAEELRRQRGLATHTHPNKARNSFPHAQFLGPRADGPQPNARPYMASQRRQ